MINRSELKQRAKELCRTSKPSLITMGLIFTVLGIVISTLSSTVISGNITQVNAQRFLAAYYNGNFEKAISIAKTFRPSGSASLIKSLLSVVSWIVDAGFLIFIINTIHGTEPAYGNILDGFGFSGKVVLLSLLESIVIGAMSLLLVVPGIIFSYAYRQALHILLENPEKSVISCLKESRLMMKGHKWELFVMDLSFLGWYILMAIVPLAGTYVSPYTTTSYALYFEKLKEESYSSL